MPKDFIIKSLGKIKEKTLSHPKVEKIIWHLRGIKRQGKLYKIKSIRRVRAEIKRVFSAYRKASFFEVVQNLIYTYSIISLINFAFPGVFLVEGVFINHLYEYALENYKGFLTVIVIAGATYHAYITRLQARLLGICSLIESSINDFCEKADAAFQKCYTENKAGEPSKLIAAQSAIDKVGQKIALLEIYKRKNAVYSYMVQDHLPLKDVRGFIEFSNESLMQAYAWSRSADESCDSEEWYGRIENIRTKANRLCIRLGGIQISPVFTLYKFGSKLVNEFWQYWWKVYKWIRKKCSGRNLFLLKGGKELRKKGLYFLLQDKGKVRITVVKTADHIPEEKIKDYPSFGVSVIELTDEQKKEVTDKANSYLSDVEVNLENSLESLYGDRENAPREVLEALQRIKFKSYTRLL